MFNPARRVFLGLVLPALALLGVLSLAGAHTATGAPAQQQPGEAAPARRIPLRAENTNAFTRVAPPAAAGPGQMRATSATFQVTYTGFTPQAQDAFQHAVDIWATQITSPVPITVSAVWEPLDTNVLGQAGPGLVRRNFTNAPQANTWYAIAVANKLAGVDLDPGVYDIEASFSSVYSNWYFGTDGLPPSGKFDFVSVVLHELGHGLGFLGSMSYSSGVGDWGFGTAYPMLYDRYTVNGSGQSLVTAFTNNSTALGTQLTSNNVYYDGPNGKAANGGARPRLYAPASWSGGSSISHLNESTYPAGDPNSLMTPQIGFAEAIHDPGPIVRGIMADSGWTIDAGTSTATATRTTCPRSGCTSTGSPSPSATTCSHRSCPTTTMTVTSTATSTATATRTACPRSGCGSGTSTATATGTTCPRRGCPTVTTTATSTATSTTTSTATATATGTPCRHSCATATATGTTCPRSGCPTGVAAMTAPPDAPVGLTAGATGTTSVDLTWEGNVAGAAGFALYRDGAIVTLVEPSVASFTVAGLRPGTTYCFTVTAFNQAGESARPTPLCITTATAG